MTDRHQFRANWHDYNEGLYFVTICCANKQHYFGEISDGEMSYNESGKIMIATINDVSKHLKDAEIWNYVVMPNHIHLVISIVGTRHGASANSPGGAPANTPIEARNLGCLKPLRHDPPENRDFHHNSRLSVIVGQIKSTVKRETNKRGIVFAWQSRFHEHIIRNQHAFQNIMNYIDSNVDNWCYDRFNRIDNINADNIKAGIINPDIINPDAPWRVPTGNNHEA